mgnify:CR=1 FL=1
MASKSLARAQRHFEKVAGMRKDNATAKAIRKLSDVWVKRKPKSVQGFHKASKAGVVVTTKGGTV